MMVSKTNEQALEATIQTYLTGTCLESLNAEVADGSGADAYSIQHYALGFPNDFNAQYAIDERKFWLFLNNTQEEELEKLKRHNSDDWKRKILERFDRMMKKYGVLHLLKKGLDVDDAHFTLMYPAPLASSGIQVVKNFHENIFSCTRQVCYNTTNPLEEIDMVLFLNGIALVTIELKNPWTGQTARYHGQKQYREDRDCRQPLLTFGRCLVHLAVDTDEVYMTTKLAGKKTFFLPFNKGCNEGKGNPVNTGGHKTAYLWQDIFSKTSLATIIQHFVRFDGGANVSLAKRTLFFPRYHQLDVVRKLIKDVSEHGVGKTYLIQHSAGSGKSNSITWAAYQLIEAYPRKAGVPGAKGTKPQKSPTGNTQGLHSGDSHENATTWLCPIFDSVIVVTDRRLLDRQLRDNIKDFSEVKNIIAPAFKSSDLKMALESGKKIIITTIQKFPFIIDGISDLSDKRFAVIIDEAHSSQSGSAHDNMNRAMGADEEEEDTQDKILKAMRTRKMRGNASYFAFTATPKNTTLEKFGVKEDDGSFRPFHLYSMKQAIEEGFILDVLANYTTYKSYYEIEKSILENPEFDSKKAQKKLRAYVERSQRTIGVKADIIMEHFIPKVVNAKKLRGKGKGMVVTQNIETAIRYYQAIQKILTKHGHPFKVLIAFSGTKNVGGVDYTEADMNGFSDAHTAEMFDKNYIGDRKPQGVNEDENRLLVVANKYLTGFDQPKLCTMYVDKKLQGVQAVQALSRLNRAASKLGKKNEDLFVLDFFNTVDDIKKSFDPFYTATSLSKATDVNVLHELKDGLDKVGVYEWQEVEEFVTRYFDNETIDQLSPLIDQAAERFNSGLELDNDAKVDFKIKAKQFVKIYGQMAAIIPFEILAWEKLYWFLKFLIPKLKVKDPDVDALDALLESVDLSSYGLERVKLNHSINLEAAESALDPQNPNPRGGHGGEKDVDPLDEIIRHFNERWFQGWSATPEEQRVKFINIAETIKTHPDFTTKYQNNQDPHTRELAFAKILNDTMLKRRVGEMELYRLFAQDMAFKSALRKSLQLTVERI